MTLAMAGKENFLWKWVVYTFNFATVYPNALRITLKDHNEDETLMDGHQSHKMIAERQNP